MVRVLNVRIHDKGLEVAASEMVESCGRSAVGSPLCVSATGAHGLVRSYTDTGFEKVLATFHANLPDGMPVVWVGKLKGSKLMSRCYGPDFFKKVMVASAEKRVYHFLCGGAEGVADNLRSVCETRFCNQNVVGTYSPPFREMTDHEIADLAKEINSKAVDIVWIGMSTPKQEIFARRLAKYTNVRFICTVGAAFDFHTGRIREAPRFLQRIGLEWLFRLLMEPKRLFRRYLKTVPLFIIYGAADVLKYHYRRIRRKKDDS